VERSEILLKIVAFIFGTAWSVLTYFVVPAIIIDKKTAIASIPHSGNTFKRTWGETVIVNIGIGLVFFLAIVALVLAGALIVSGGHAGIALGSGVVFCGALVVLIIMSSVLDSVLKTLLYIYANENVVPSNFNSELLAQILGRKGSGVPVPNMVPPVV
jgi:hypothetical protein